MPFHTPPSAEVAGYAGFSLFEALSDLLIIKDVLTRNEVNELLARTASRLQTSPNEVGARTADFVLSALAGSVIGGLTSGYTTWLTQRSQARAGMVAHDLARREHLPAA
jgi:hypothetical protein